MTFDVRARDPSRGRGDPHGREGREHRGGHVHEGRREPSYREHRPHVALRRHVACYWTLFPTHGSVAGAHRVLPDGCMDLLFRVGADGNVSPSIIGTMTTAIVAPAACLVAFVGVRFLPGEAFAFLDLEASLATDLELSPHDAGLGDPSPLLAALGRAAPGEWPRLLDQYLLARLSIVRSPDERVRGAVSLLVGSKGATKVSDVAASVGASERQLARLFQERVGISPKALARVSRVQALVSVLGTQSPSSLSWAGLAASLGYADQSHLVREVRAIAGVTPGALLRERMSVSSNTAGDPAATFLAHEQGADT